uniref:Putative secreted protein n=1 Tax=Anopheles darlingi TaxID=43151 RepID=A0A2M4D466_ANODA
MIRWHVSSLLFVAIILCILSVDQNMLASILGVGTAARDVMFFLQQVATTTDGGDLGTNGRTSDAYLGRHGRQLGVGAVTLCV